VGAATPTDRLRPLLRQGRGGRAAVLVCAAALLAGCGSGGGAHSGSARIERTRAALGRYLHEVEPLRLAVNRLLNGADPIVDGFHEHRFSAHEAAKRMGALERKFASYTVAVALIKPTLQPLARLQSEYAATFIYEDSYLSALVSGYEEGGDFDHLPETQSLQRSTIIRWRTGLEALARETGFPLPADLQQAGRGEVAPSPTGGS
jgi:hypothetical protein